MTDHRRTHVFAGIGRVAPGTEAAISGYLKVSSALEQTGGVPPEDCNLSAQGFTDNPRCVSAAKKHPLAHQRRRRLSGKCQPHPTSIISITSKLNCTGHILHCLFTDPPPFSLHNASDITSAFRNLSCGQMGLSQDFGPVRHKSAKHFRKQTVSQGISQDILAIYMSERGILSTYCLNYCPPSCRPRDRPRLR